MVVWNRALIFPYIGNNDPNWRTHIFQRGSNHPQISIKLMEYDSNSSNWWITMDISYHNEPLSWYTVIINYNILYAPRIWIICSFLHHKWSRGSTSPPWRVLLGFEASKMGMSPKKIMRIHTLKKYVITYEHIYEHIWTGWWFGTFFHILGIKNPTDFQIFKRGRYTTNQWKYRISMGI